MQNNPLIDVPKIEEIIDSKHKKFIGEFGPEIDKVVADKRLITDIIFSRIYLVLLCFQKSQVIDTIKISEGYPKEITLRKQGFDNHVHILTNGHQIRLEGYAYDSSDFNSDIAYPSKTYRKVNEEKYDWTKFAEELLDYIHASIYDRKDVVETKMSGIFKS